MKKPKVAILCGGLGARLREETEFRPKPMVKIGSYPILWHIMKLYSHYGLNEFVLCLGYKGEMIKEYFYNYEILSNDFTIEIGCDKSVQIHRQCDETGWKVTLADTGDKALKGARLKRAQKYIDTDIFMVTYGDGLAKIDLGNLIEFHKSHGKIATLTGVNPASRFGELKVEGDRVLKFSEKPDDTDELVNGGFFVFNRQIFDYLSEDDACDLEYGPLERVAADGQLMVYRQKDFWACMDTLRDMDYLNGLWNSGRAEWAVWK